MIPDWLKLVTTKLVTTSNHNALIQSSWSIYSYILIWDWHSQICTCYTPYIVNQREAILISRQLGGELPMPDNAKDMEKISKFDFGTAKNECHESTWMPIVRSKYNRTTWLNAINNSEAFGNLLWSFGQPNGYPSQNCVCFDKVRGKTKM